MPEQYEQQISSQDLAIGMYVSSLDRPWLETPFLFQGLYIRKQEEIELFQKYCKYVYISIEKSDPVHKIKRPPVHKPPSAEVLSSNLGERHKTHGPPATTFDTELKQAKDSHEELHDMIGSVMDDAHNGKPLQLPEVREAVSPMIDSIVRNPDAFMWLMTLKRKDEYTYTHSLNASVLAVNLGRKLGFPRKDLQEISLGALLFDIGKIKLPKELLNKPEKYTAVEHKVVERHVQYGVEILSKAKGITKEIITMVLHHHERFNGSGYPKGISGDKIPVFGRIAALVDCFDAITSNRPYANAMSPYHAALKLYEWRGIDFQPELVEQFIQAIGIYPTGTLIELKGGEVGVILSQNRARHLRPKVMLILGKDKQALGNYPIIDMDTEFEDSEGNPIEIAHALEPGAYNIDLQELYI